MMCFDLWQSQKHELVGVDGDVVEEKSLKDAGQNMKCAVQRSGAMPLSEMQAAARCLFLCEPLASVICSPASVICKFATQ